MNVIKRNSKSNLGYRSALACSHSWKSDNLIKIFKIRKDECWLTVVSLLIFTFFNALVIASHFKLYTLGAKGGFYTIFYKHFQMSGYDCWSWIAASGWRIHFETIRHPLLMTILYPFYLLDHTLIHLTGVNLTVFMIAVVLIVCAVYSFLFMFRVFHEVVGLNRSDSSLLTFLFFSFAHVLIPTMVPDHFVISMLLLTLTMYVAGMKMKTGKLFPAIWSFVLVFLSAGISATNGAKIILAGVFANGRRFFTWKNVLLGVVLPLALLLGIQRCQYHAVEVPQQEAIHKIEEAKWRKDSVHVMAHQASRNQWLRSHGVVSSGKGLLTSMMNFETPRGKTLIENFFGESFQLHQQHLMEDLSWNRPVFVAYNWVLNYIVEGLIVGLFVCGIWRGIHSRFLQMLLTWFACDVTLHLIMGFGIGEVYIMTSGWAFIVPVSIAYLIKGMQEGPRKYLRIFLIILTLYLWLYNGIQLTGYLLRGMQ